MEVEASDQPRSLGSITRPWLARGCCKGQHSLQGILLGYLLLGPKWTLALCACARGPGPALWNTGCCYAMAGKDMAQLAHAALESLQVVPEQVAREGDGVQVSLVTY